MGVIGEVVRGDEWEAEGRDRKTGRVL
jgi:hypothetical protein